MTAAAGARHRRGAAQTQETPDDSEKVSMAVSVDADTTEPDTTAEDTATVADEAADEAAGETDEAADEADDAVGEAEGSPDAQPDADGVVAPKRRISWSRVVVFGVLPVLALVLAAAAGYLKWQDASVRTADLARIESVQVAKDSTIALLSYRPETVDQQLGAARDLLTGDFKNSYTSLTTDVVIPGAKQKQISAVVTVPAVASVSATPTHAVVLVFVNQTVIVGQDAPTDTASTVRVTMDKIGGHWLISEFDPI